MRGPEPLLLVADRANVRIQIFDLNHGYKGSVEHDLRYPCGFAFAGETLIIPDLHACVTLYDGQNALAAVLGDTPAGWTRPGWPNIPKADRHPGHFSSPHAAWADSHGDIYVVEWIEDGRLTKLKRT
jgi:hypothetical protein